MKCLPALLWHQRSAKCSEVDDRSLPTRLQGVFLSVKWFMKTFTMKLRPFIQGCSVSLSCVVVWTFLYCTLSLQRMWSSFTERLEKACYLQLLKKRATVFTWHATLTLPLIRCIVNLYRCVRVEWWDVAVYCQRARRKYQRHYIVMTENCRND